MAHPSNASFSSLYLRKPYRKYQLQATAPILLSVTFNPSPSISQPDDNSLPFLISPTQDLLVQVPKKGEMVEQFLCKELRDSVMKKSDHLLSTH